MRPSTQPVLWKWVLSAREWKIISMSEAEHLTSFWYRGPGEMAYKAVYPGSSPHGEFQGRDVFAGTYLVDLSPLQTHYHFVKIITLLFTCNGHFWKYISCWYKNAKSTMFISAASVLVLIGKAYVHYTFEFPPKCFIFPTKMLSRPLPPPPPPKKKLLKCSDNAYHRVAFCKSANVHDFFKTFFSRPHDKTPNLTVFWEIFWEEMLACWMKTEISWRILLSV